MFEWDASEDTSKQPGGLPKLDIKVNAKSEVDAG